MPLVLKQAGKYVRPFKKTVKLWRVLCFGVLGWCAFGLGVFFGLFRYKSAVLIVSMAAHSTPRCRWPAPSLAPRGSAPLPRRRSRPRRWVALLRRRSRGLGAAAGSGPRWRCRGRRGPPGTRGGGRRDRLPLPPLFAQGPQRSPLRGIEPTEGTVSRRRWEIRR